MITDTSLNETQMGSIKPTSCELQLLTDILQEDILEYSMSPNIFTVGIQQFRRNQM